MLAVVTDAHFVPARPGTPQPTDPVVLTGADLTIADVEAVARHGAEAALDVHARARMQEARDVIERLVAAGDVVYGVTTGFGDLATTFIPPEDAAALQENLIASHAAGVGRPFPREVVRAMLLLRANTLALGHSGCRPLLVDRICAFLELGIHPVVPEQGSVGASGDLAPLAHLALPLIGTLVCHFLRAQRARIRPPASPRRRRRAVHLSGPIRSRRGGT